MEPPRSSVSISTQLTNKVAHTTFLRKLLLCIDLLTCQAAHALVVVIEAEWLNTIDLFLVALAAAFNHFGGFKVIEI